MAKNWLETCNKKNRAVSEQRVNRYARDMKNGKWLLNGEPIIFDASGHLLNGQHRLRAIVKSETPITSVVVSGVDSETFVSMDQCKPRSSADVLAMKGEKCASKLAASARVLYGITISKIQGGDSLPPSELMDFLEEHPDLRKHCVTASPIICGLLNQSVLHALQYITHRGDEAKAKAFWKALEGGENLQKGSPILSLRRKFELNMTRRAKPSTIEQIISVVKAWNAFFEGRALSMIYPMNKAGQLVIPRICGYDPRSDANIPDETAE